MSGAPSMCGDEAASVEAWLFSQLPAGYLGPVVLPASGRTVWWTGRIAIGLRYQRCAHTPSSGESWLQGLLLGGQRTALTDCGAWRPGSRSSGTRGGPVAA